MDYNIGLSVRTFIVKENMIKQTKLYCIDLCETEETDNTNNVFGTTLSNTIDNSTTKIVSPKLYEKTLMNEPLKTSSYYKINNLFEDILDKYYELYLKNVKNDNRKIIWDTYDEKKLIHYCQLSSNIIAMESRIGQANIIIIPDEKYIINRYFLSYLKDYKFKIILNNTNIHKDKIFIIRLDKESTTPGLSLFATRNITNLRYNKLITLMSKMGKTPNDFVFDYILTEVGTNSNKLVQVISIK